MTTVKLLNLVVANAIYILVDGTKVQFDSSTCSVANNTYAKMQAELTDCSNGTIVVAEVHYFAQYNTMLEQLKKDYDTAVARVEQDYKNAVGAAAVAPIAPPVIPVPVTPSDPVPIVLDNDEKV
jgi:hypothetical protein